MMNPPSNLIEAFEAVAGRREDGLWAGVVLMRMGAATLAPPEAERELHQALALVRDSGESADDLFGDPRQWADERIAELSAQGASFVDDATSLNTAAVVGLGLGGAGALLCFVLVMFKAGMSPQWSLGVALMPVLVSVAAVALLTLRERLLRRFSERVSLGVTLLALGPVIVGMALAMMHGPSLGRHSVFWWLVEAGVLFGAAWVAGRCIPEPAPRTVPTSGLSDQAWLAEARARLRERGDLTEAQISGHLDEARAHALASGTGLGAEFGNPVGYARSLPGDQVVRKRRGALALSAAVVVIGAVNAESGWEWWRVALIVLVALAALRAWGGWWGARRGRGPGRR